MVISSLMTAPSAALPGQLCPRSSHRMLLMWTSRKMMTAEFFAREVICCQSTPAEAISDQGGEFQGDFQALLARQVRQKD